MSEELTMAGKPEILFIDDDPKAGELMRRFSEGAAYALAVFREPHAALDHFKSKGADLVISDLRMPGMSGIELLRAIREIDSDVPYIIVTGFADVDNAIEALRLGATDFLKKPFDMDEMRIEVEKTLEHRALLRENQLLKRQLSDERNRYGMVGHSPAMQKVYAIIDKIANVRCNVIIEGESGTGKELAARAIHYQSELADKPFIVIDCGALTDTLLESELFGHERGAFTGAVKARRGLLEEASGGTVFLDEIGNISDAMQVKLLRVVQEQQITHVGGVKPIRIDVRFIVATNQDLEQRVTEGSFRHDLYHRLNVVKLRMPSLHEHPEDVPPLVQDFIDRLSRQYKRDIIGFDAESMQRLMRHDWPGNVRELQNLVERHIALADGPMMQLEALQSVRPMTVTGVGTSIDADLPALEELERRYILKVLEYFHENREQTAVTLGVNKSTLWRKLQQYRPREGGEEE